jgi:hypothetical protein
MPCSGYERHHLEVVTEITNHPRFVFTHAGRNLSPVALGGHKVLFLCGLSGSQLEPRPNPRKTPEGNLSGNPEIEANPWSVVGRGK